MANMINILNDELNMIYYHLSNLRNNKKAEIDGISNEHMKYANSKMQYVIKFIMDTVLNTGIIPDEFNIAIIKPLLKDKTKADDDDTNIRQISISMCITNILENI